MVEVTVARASGGWEAWLGGEPAGALRADIRPDRRCWGWFRDCHTSAYHPLVAAACAELDRDLFTEVGEPERRHLIGLGFEVWRRQRHYRVQTGPALRVAVPSPSEVDVISAAEADLDRLRVLDDALRQEIPGSDGWRWSPEEFREETFSTGFDPDTYRVAVHRLTGAYVGLVRVWLRPAGPRLGCVGVLPEFRRTRVTAALLGTVLGVLRDRGHRDVVTEIDTTNRPALALASRCQAVHTGDSYVLVLRLRRDEVCEQGASCR